MNTAESSAGGMTCKANRVGYPTKASTHTPRVRGTAMAVVVGWLFLTAQASDFEWRRWSIDGGGAMFCTGGDLELSGTLGQADVGVMSGDEFTLSCGFWFPLAPGDCNTDGTTDLFDFDSLFACASGPDGAPPPGCGCYDLDGDGDVDVIDFAAFQRNFSGA